MEDVLVSMNNLFNFEISVIHLFINTTILLNVGVTGPSCVKIMTVRGHTKSR